MVLDQEMGGQEVFLFKTATKTCEALNLPLSLKPGARLWDNIIQIPQEELPQNLKEVTEIAMEVAHCEKPLHRQYFANIKELNLSKQLFFAFLSWSVLYSKTSHG